MTLDEKVVPSRNMSWVEAALAELGVDLADIADSVADAAVFAASEAIRDQGVEGQFTFWEIDVLHSVMKDIVLRMLRQQAVMPVITYDENAEGCNRHRSSRHRPQSAIAP
jgi:hypothetical protein